MSAPQDVMSIRLATMEARESALRAALIDAQTRLRRAGGGQGWDAAAFAALSADVAGLRAEAQAQRQRADEAEERAEDADRARREAEADAAALRRQLAAALQGAGERTTPGLPQAPRPARLAPVRGVASPAATPEEAVLWVVSSGSRVRAQANGKITKERLQADDAAAFLEAVFAVRAAAEGTAARAQAHSRALAEMAALARKA